MSEHHGIKYAPLSLSVKQIRTLTLHAGGARDLIQCYLDTVSLDDQPAYEALSYTWGDASVTELIEVDGTHINVTSNLERALRHLRDAENDLTLWVDAVCINQTDIEEKSRQVALMGRIYQQCSQVRVWLGCNDADCGLEPPQRRVDSAMDEPPKQQDPFELVRHLAGDRHIHEWLCFEVSDERDKLTLKENKGFNDCWTGFLMIARSAWWTRMWTVQEVILPKAGVLTYDTWSTRLDDITKCGTNYYSHVWGCCQQAISILPITIRIPLDELCTTFLTLDRDRNTLAEDEYFDIQEQHLSYGSRQCQNPRDKVYGLLALIGDISKLDLWLTPNYSFSEHKIFYDTTCAMLFRDFQSLKCLTGAQYGPGTNKWASWVRNFGAPLDQLDADIGSNRLMIYDLFNASGGRKAQTEHFMTWPQLADEKPHQAGLGVTGRYVGTVALVCSEMVSEDTPERVEQQRRTFVEWVRTSGVDIKEHNDAQKDPGTVEAFWRTVLSGIASVGNESTEYSDWRRFSNKEMAWLRPFLSFLDNGTSDWEFAIGRTILTATYGRCYYRTFVGGQGLCYPTAKTGDEVWVINGSKVPFILRHVELNNEESAELRPLDAYGPDDEGVYGVKKDFESEYKPDKYYELVGDCYLDNFMDGEAVEDADLEEKCIVLL